MTQKQMRKGVIIIENYSENALYDFAGRLNNKFKAYECLIHPNFLKLIIQVNLWYCRPINMEGRLGYE